MGKMPATFLIKFGCKMNISTHSSSLFIQNAGCRSPQIFTKKCSNPQHGFYFQESAKTEESKKDNESHDPEGGETFQLGKIHEDKYQDEKDEDSEIP